MSLEKPSQIISLTTEQEQLITSDTEQLMAYAAAHGLRQLEGRIQHGLDPSGMLAVGETRALAARIAETVGTTIDEAEAFISALHTQGPWQNVEKLKDGGTTPEAKWYLHLASACMEKNDDSELLDKQGYLLDRARVVAELTQYTETESSAREELFNERLQERVYSIPGFQVEEVDGVKVPVAEGYPFIGMAAQGYEAGVSRTGPDGDAKTLYFSATAAFHESTLEAVGVVPVFAELYNPTTQSMERVAADSEEAKQGRLVYGSSNQLDQDLRERQGALKRISPGYYLAYGDKNLAVRLVAEELRSK
ncbi:MAG: hypothetical protein WCK01_03660 [Candidatus Uhrbacteria bacterium]